MTSKRGLHVITFHVEGLNLKNEKFVWNDKMIFRDGKTELDNVAEVHVLIKKPFPESFSDKDLKKDEENREEALLIVGIFLGCFKLVNPSADIEWNLSEMGAYSVESTKSFKTMDSTETLWSPMHSEYPTPPVKLCLNNLQKTVPLFEKVMQSKHMRKKQYLDNNPLAGSLSLYQKITETQTEVLIEYVRVIESLLCKNETRIKKKFAKRTSQLIEQDLQKRKDIYEFLKSVYEIRSDLIHGSDIVLDEGTEEETGVVLSMDAITRKVLMRYIDLIDSGLNKEQIIQRLDNNT